MPDGDAAGFVRVPTPGEADVVLLLRLEAPYEERGPGFESFFHAGPLDLADDAIAHVAEVAAAVPTVVDVHLDRPAILTPLLPALPEGTAVFVVTFGVGTPALLDALTGAVPPEGRLPFDTADPLYRFGDGITLNLSLNVAEPSTST